MIMNVILDIIFFMLGIEIIGGVMVGVFILIVIWRVIL